MATMSTHRWLCHDFDCRFDDLAGAAAALGERVACHDDLICSVLWDFASEVKDPVQVASEIFRLHGLLDLAWTADAQLLYDRIKYSTGDVVLTLAEEGAYQRTVDRLNAMCTLGSALDRFLD